VDVELAPVALDVLAERGVIELRLSGRWSHACVTALMSESNRIGHISAPAPILPSEERLRLRGDTVVHRRCATYRIRNHGRSGSRLGFPG
jgi:hypothetical protein